MSASAVPDAQLVAQALRGSADAFAALVERYLATALAVARAHVANPADSDDAVQEAFLLAYKKLHTLRDPARFGHWLLTIARNESSRIVTRRRSTIGGDPAAVADRPAADPTPAQRETGELLRAHIESLPDTAREILQLHYFAGHSTREIAELLNLRQAAVLKRLQRAREQLAETMLHDLEATRPSRAEVAKQLARITALTGGLSIGGAVASGGLVSAAGALFVSKASMMVAGAISAGIAVVGVTGYMYESQPRPSIPQEISGERIRAASVAAQTPEKATPNAPAQDGDSERTPAQAASLESSGTQGGTVSSKIDLRREVKLDVKNLHLAKALLQLEEQTGIIFAIDRNAVGVPGESVPPEALPMRPYPADGKVRNVQAQNVPLGEAIDAFLTELGLKAVLAPGYLWISTPAHIRADGKTYPKGSYVQYAETLSPASLARPASFAFKDVHVSEVLQFINEVYDMNIVLDSRVVAPPEGPYETAVYARPKCTNGKVSYINLKGVRLADALTALARQMDLTFSVRSDYIWISSARMIRSDELFPLRPDERKTMDEILAAPITVAFEDVTFEEILQFLAEIYDVSIALDQRVIAWTNEPTSAAPLPSAAHAPKDVSHGQLEYVSLPRVPLASALDIVTRCLGLAYEVRGDVMIIVSTADRLASKDPRAMDLIPAVRFAAMADAVAPGPVRVTRVVKSTPNLETVQQSASRPPGLILIDKVGDKFRALIDTGGRPYWFDERQSFGGYTLMNIDEKAGCVELFDEQLQKSVKICGVTKRY